MSGISCKYVKGGFINFVSFLSLVKTLRLSRVLAVYKQFLLLMHVGNYRIINECTTEAEASLQKVPNIN